MHNGWSACLPAAVAVAPWLLWRYSVSTEAHGGVLFCPGCCGALWKPHGGVLFCPACCGALQKRTVACCYGLAIPVLCRGTRRRALKRCSAVGAPGRGGAASHFKAARLRRNFRLPGLHPRLPEFHCRLLEFQFRLLESHFRLPEVPGARAGGFAALDLGPSTLNLRPARALDL